jgi:alkanesulfonate monooxygenase SsuD/methylene tetrahydromethanopterin reductase-like flavin-dependent oxidoreductase (luciferase family)
VGRAGAGPAERRSFQAERMASLSYDDILAKKVAFGTPAQLIGRLKHLQAELGVDGILLEPNSGGLIPPALERESLRLFTHEVIPAFRR